MTTLLIIVFVVTYGAIAFEERLKAGKAGAALIGAGLLWIVYAIGTGDPPTVDAQLATSLTSTAQVAFFLIGAMTVVEVIDLHDGFEVITARIEARSLPALTCTLAGLAFVLSAVLDNLTTAIVMVSLVRKLVAAREDRLVLAGIIVIAANAGGAWSPIGDVTTSMLWIGGRVTSFAIVTGVLLPSLINLAVPLGMASYKMRGRIVARPTAPVADAERSTSRFERNLVFGLGVAVLLAVPLFKAVMHLPPFIAVLFGLGILWVVADLIHRGKEGSARAQVTIGHALQRIDMSAILFFIAILLAVASLEHAGVLAALARWLDDTIGRLDLVVAIIGLGSAIIDNVPMVAAAMGMYPLQAHPADSLLWEFLAYAAGTGGSILVIGSAAGIAAMGIEKIGFVWYLKRFSGPALLGYLAGALTYLAQYQLFG